MATTRMTTAAIAALALAGCGGDEQDNRGLRALHCVDPVDNRYTGSIGLLSTEGLLDLDRNYVDYYSGYVSNGTISFDIHSTSSVISFADFTYSAKSTISNSGTLLINEGPATRARKDGIQIGLDGDIDLEIVPPESGSCVLARNPEAPEVLFIISDGLPDYDTSGFPNSESPNAVTASQRVFRVPAIPSPAAQVTELSANAFDGVLLNGVLIQHRENLCVGADCGLPYSANPMHAPALHGMDEHHAHTLPDGTYHYHGDPRDLYIDDGTLSGIIGLAADGYPIFGPWFDEEGVVRKATSSYQLKSGSVTTEAGEYFYNGTYTEDYQYVADSGDLDECNGMEIGGQYGYYITDTFPYIMNCLRGTPDSSFGFPTP